MGTQVVGRKENFTVARDWGGNEAECIDFAENADNCGECIQHNATLLLEPEAEDHAQALATVEVVQVLSFIPPSVPCPVSSVACARVSVCALSLRLW